MSNSLPNQPPHRQKKYRTGQSNKGLVRYEIQIDIQAKKRFEQLVEAAADEFDQPWDKRRRMAKARAQIFDELTQNIKHDFFELQSQILNLKEEIKALSPSFFNLGDDQDQPPLPEAIKSLPDNPKHLKQLLTKNFLETQKAKRQALEFKRQANQYEKLYSTIYDENESLSAKLREQETEDF